MHTEPERPPIGCWTESWSWTILLSALCAARKASLGALRGESLRSLNGYVPPYRLVMIVSREALIWEPPPNSCHLVLEWNTTMLILLNAPPPPPKPLAADFGPPVPALKGANMASASFSVARASRSALREMRGAIVVVEEDGLPPMAKQRASASLFRGKLRLMPRKVLPVFPATPSMPRWMDPNVTMSG